MEEEFVFKLGDSVRSKSSEHEGIIIGIYLRLYDTTTYSVRSRILTKDGDIAPSYSYGADSLVLVEAYELPE